MNLDELREEISADEGVKYEIYLDHIGYKTMGIGHLCIAGVDPEYDLAVGTPVAVERVNELFDKDIKRTIADCKIVHDDFDDLPEEVQKILANMCFQMGLGRFMKFHNTHDLVKKRFWDGVSQEMLDSRWAEQTPARAKRLSRRMAELAV
jgi:lysozyme